MPNKNQSFRPPLPKRLVTGPENAIFAPVVKRFGRGVKNTSDLVLIWPNGTQLVNLNL